MSAPFTLAPFSQSHFLLGETDPEVAGGVCVALCNLWLQMAHADRDEPAAERMKRLALKVGAAKQHQKEYARQRRLHGRGPARQMVGAPLGLAFEENTTVMRVFVGQAGVEDRIVRDLAVPGASAAWSMRFLAGGGHAIAGFNRLEGQEPIHYLHANVFDPNIGEYSAPLPALPAVVSDLFRRVPMYGTVSELHRADVSTPL